MNPHIKTLVIEDDTVLRETIQKFLGIYHDVYGAANIQSAKEMLRLHKFHLVLLDKSLPDGAGLSLLPEIHIANPESAVIVLTGDGDFNSVTAALFAGADDYLVKSEHLIPNLLVRFPVAIKHAEARRLSQELQNRIDIVLPSSLEEVTSKNYKEFLSCVEREYLSRIIEICDGDTSSAAEKIGLSRSTMFRKIAELGINKGASTRKSQPIQLWNERL